jgi:hypothetical protein
MSPREFHAEVLASIMEMLLSKLGLHPLAITDHSKKVIRL